MKTSDMKTKEQLEASAKQYQDALESDLDEIISKTKSILTGAVVIGAGFWIAYSIFKSFSNQSDDSNNDDLDNHTQHQHKEPSVFNVVKQAIMKELAMFLLGIIKEKVFEYLQEVKPDESDT